jgi:hypothetical protein
VFNIDCDSFSTEISPGLRQLTLDTSADDAGYLFVVKKFSSYNFVLVNWCKGVFLVRSSRTTSPERNAKRKSVKKNTKTSKVTIFFIEHRPNVNRCETIGCRGLMDLKIVVL